MKKEFILDADGTTEGQTVNQTVSSWRWGKDGWTGQGSRSGAGYEVQKAFGLK